MISACVHTLSVSPLNSEAFKELKVLFAFVPPTAIPMVLSSGCLINSCGLIKFSQTHILNKLRNWSLPRENAQRYSS